MKILDWTGMVLGVLVVVLLGILGAIMIIPIIIVGTFCTLLLSPVLVLLVVLEKIFNRKGDDER